MKKMILLVAASFMTLLLAARPDPIDVEYGPWVTNVSENSFTILWTTKTDNLGWVEVTSDLNTPWGKLDVEQYHPTFAGRWQMGRMHSVTVTGLKKGTLYRYRVCGQKVVDDSKEQDVVLGMVKKTKIFSVKTFDADKQDCHFSAVNDVHMDKEMFSSLMNQMDMDNTDFVLLNGDITSAANYTLDTLIAYAVAPIGKALNRIPVMFSRGNHEGRGNNWMASYQIFPTRTPNQFYYTFRQGPVAFIVLDAGETKTAVSTSYTGGPYYKDYLEEELAWAKEAVREEEFAEAPLKVCIIHVPMNGGPTKSEYTTQNWMSDNFIPLLNEAGVNLAINAHSHKYSLTEPNDYLGNKFPMIVNGKNTRLQFDADANGISIRIYDLDGKVVNSFEVKK